MRPGARTRGGAGEGKMAAPQSDWKAHRFGAAPPASLPSLRSDAALSVLSACGVPVSLATDADGTSQRMEIERAAGLSGLLAAE